MFTIQLTEEQVAALHVRDGKRSSKKPREVIKDARDAYELLKHMGQLSKEHCIILTLDSRAQVIAKHEISVGTVDASLVHPREVFKQAIIDSAKWIILTHNHPSGNVEPSEDDMLLTKRIKTAGQIMGISVLDHIIIGQDTYYSFREHEIM